MLDQTSQDFKILFLLEFTKELIRHSRGEVFVLENVLDEEKKELKGKVKGTSKDSNELGNLKSILLQENKSLFNKNFNARPTMNNSQIIRKPLPAVLRIPEPKLPARLQYLRPVPTKVQIDLGKLNPLVKDPMVKVIQCDGPDSNISVQGAMGTKHTDISLSKEEIKGVLQKFSEEAKIPIDEGAIRIVVGNLILLAVISEVVSTKFIIKKMINSGSMLIR